MARFCHYDALDVRRCHSFFQTWLALTSAGKAISSAPDRPTWPSRSSTEKALKTFYSTATRRPFWASPSTPRPTSSLPPPATAPSNSGASTTSVASRRGATYGRCRTTRWRRKVGASSLGTFRPPRSPFRRRIPSRCHCYETFSSSTNGGAK